jgi:carboxylesterase type B
LQLPASTTDVLKPVMAYIHGGAFCLGSGNSEMHGPSPIMDTGEVVLVTMNYRLGALGKNMNKTRWFGLQNGISRLENLDLSKHLS